MLTCFLFQFGKEKCSGLGDDASRGTQNKMWKTVFHGRLGLGSVSCSSEERMKADVRRIMSATVIATCACVNSHEIGNLEKRSFSYSFL